MESNILPVFTIIWNGINGPMQTLSTQLTANLQGVMSGWFPRLVCAYLVAMLVIAMWSGKEQMVLWFWRHLLAAAVVYTLISQLGYYQEWVSGPVAGTMTKLTNAVLGSGGKTVPEAFGHIRLKCYVAGVAVFNAIPKSSYAMMIPLGFTVVCFWLLCFLIIGAVFTLYTASVILNSYVLAYGPIFIAMWFFEPTKKFFDGWFRALFAGMLSQLFLTGSLALIISAMQVIVGNAHDVLGQTGKAATTGDVISMIWALLGISILVVFFLGIALLSVFLAVQITGGAHASFTQMMPGGDRSIAGGTNTNITQSRQNAAIAGPPGGSNAIGATPSSSYSGASPVTPLGKAP